MFLEHHIPLSLDLGVLAHELFHGPYRWAFGLFGWTGGSGACAAFSLAAIAANWGTHIMVLIWVVLVLLICMLTLFRNKCCGSINSYIMEHKVHVIEKMWPPPLALLPL